MNGRYDTGKIGTLWRHIPVPDGAERKQVLWRR